jgi:hypothetical protein
MDFGTVVLPLVCSVAGALMALIAYANRRRPRLRPYLDVLYLIAAGQIVWGAVFWVLLNG